MVDPGSHAQRSESSENIVVLSRQQWIVLNELIQILPQPPEPGLSKQAILDLLIGEATPGFRESRWRNYYNAILLTRRVREQRQPGIPIIENTGQTNREPRYQLLGFTGQNGEPLLFNRSIQLYHARLRRLGDLRTRATSTSEMVAMGYIADILDAATTGNRARVRQLCQALVSENMTILPALSALALVAGVPLQQARPLREFVENLRNALTTNPSARPFIGRYVEQLERGVSHHLRYFERPLRELTEQLTLIAVQVYGNERVREVMDRRAQRMLADHIAEEDAGT